MARTVRDFIHTEEPLDGISIKLVELARESGSNDNITVLVVFLNTKHLKESVARIKREGEPEDEEEKKEEEQEEDMEEDDKPESERQSDSSGLPNSTPDTTDTPEAQQHQMKVVTDSGPCDSTVNSNANNNNNKSHYHQGGAADTTFSEMDAQPSPLCKNQSTISSHSSSTESSTDSKSPRVKGQSPVAKTQSNRCSPNYPSTRTSKLGSNVSVDGNKSNSSSSSYSSYINQDVQLHKGSEKKIAPSSEVLAFMKPNSMLAMPESQNKNTMASLLKLRSDMASQLKVKPTQPTTRNTLQCVR